MKSIERHRFVDYTETWIRSNVNDPDSKKWIYYFNNKGVKVKEHLLTGEIKIA